MASGNIINNSHSNSYICGSQVYILSDFSPTEMNELTGNLGNLIFSLPEHPVYRMSGTLTSPYDTQNIKNPIIDIFIDSSGGSTNELQNLSTLLNIAKSRGAIIRTTVMSRAFSCGCLLAIQGTPGFRIMAHDARNMVHFGSASIFISNPDDLSVRAQQVAAHKKIVHDKYKIYTKIPQKKLDKMMRCESGYLTADECLKYGLCDWIISERGKLISAADMKQKILQKTI